MWKALWRSISNISGMTDNVLFERGSRTSEPLPLRRDTVVKLNGWFGRFIRYQVPVGHEDETGFHYGIEPSPNESSHSFDI
jgi:hypothetical protein